MAVTDIPEDLLELERSAWAAIQAGTLTTELASAVHQGIAALTEAEGVPRIQVEEALKKAVRHPASEAGRE